MIQKLLSVLSIVLSLACTSRQEKKKTGSTPNVILILTDDQGYSDVGVFGAADIHTPHLDQMAKDGIQLTHYYAAQAICSASRAGILTGCYPNRIGIHNALMPKSTIGLHAAETTLAEMLNANGYTTGIFGKWHLGDHAKFLPTAHGFDSYFGLPYSNDMWPFHPEQGTTFQFDPLPLYQNNTVVDTITDQTNLTTLLTEKSIEFIRKNKDGPFFLYMPHPQPHVPLSVSEKFKGKSNRGLYGDVIMEIDWSVGQILKTLKDEGLAENTIVIFTSDNGPWLTYGDHAGSADPLKEGKGTAWEGGQREPCIIQYPDKLKAGRIINTPIMAIDILPTIAEITKSQLPKTTIDGKSVWSLLNGTSKDSPQEAYFFYSKINELVGVRFNQWKLYFPHSYRSMDGQVLGKDGHPGIYINKKLDSIALYDLTEDPEEKMNRAYDHPEIVKQITDLANVMRQRLGDSLLDIKGSEIREPGTID